MFRTVVAVAFLLSSASLQAQQRRYDQDSTLNNLVHPDGYETCAMDTLGRVTKVGSGPQSMVLIAGAGFGGDIFDAFMESRKGSYTMFAVTLPGFGGTPAPPMPPAGTSYGEQTWTKSAQRAIERLVDEENLKKPVIIGHWLNATQVALGLALERSEKVGAVIVISGRAKFMQVGPRPGPPLQTSQQRAQLMDTVMAPRWFKTVTRDTWDDNNFYPHDYARHPVRALQLWRQAYNATLPVWVRYLCEGQARDISLEMNALQVPTLILKPGFDKDLYVQEGLDYMRAFCHDSWDGIGSVSDQITVQTIEDSRVFIMDDQPEKLNEAIESFLSKHHLGGSKG